MGAAVAAGCAVAFGILAHQVYAGSVERFDEAILVWMARHRTPDRTGWFLAITALGTIAVTGLLGTGLCLALWLGRRPGAALALAAGLLGSTALYALLKQWFSRPRPAVVGHIVGASGYAFPSGHTTQAVAFFVTLGLLAATHIQRRAVRIVLVAYSLGIGALVALSRIYLGVHYPSDTLGGTLVGVCWAITVVMAEHRWRHTGTRA